MIITDISRFFYFVGDLSCPELTAIGFLFEQRSTGATARRSDCPPANGC
ncbi:MAG: hypothetical protein LBT09_08675 [Planctomycetaceae bacterium]|nr:hypothetical protein [Planctomycetaceae bacterium]